MKKDQRVRFRRFLALLLCVLMMTQSSGFARFAEAVSAAGQQMDGESYQAAQAAQEQTEDSASGEASGRMSASEEETASETESPEPGETLGLEGQEGEKAPAPGTPESGETPGLEGQEGKTTPAPGTPESGETPGPEGEKGETTPAPGSPESGETPGSEGQEGEITPAPGSPESGETPGLEDPEGETTPAPGAPDSEETPGPEDPEGETTPAPEEPEGEMTPAPESPEGEITPAPESPEGEITPTPGAPEEEEMSASEEENGENILYSSSISSKLLDNTTGTSVTVKDGSGRDLTGPYKAGDVFEMQLSYTLDNAKKDDLVQQANSQGADTVRLEYTLPQGISLPDGQSRDGSIIPSGEFHIVGDKVYFDIPVSYLTDHSNVQGTFLCSFNVVESTVGTDDNAHLKFEGKNEDILISFEKPSVDAKKEYDYPKVTVDKDGQWWVNYKITVTANSRGVKEGIVLLDTPGSNLEIDKASVKVDGVPAQAQEGENENSFQITGLTFEPGAAKTVTYRARIKNLQLDQDDDGKIDGLENEVQWKLNGEGSWNDGQEPWPDVSRVPGRASKSASVSGSKITWTVELNKDGNYQTDIAGKVYTDKLTSETQDYVQDSFRIYKDDQDVTETYKQYLKFGDKTFTFTLPAGSPEYSRFKITYDTKPEKEPGLGEVSSAQNQGSFDGETFSASGTISPNVETVKKEAVGEFDPEDGYSLIWKITVTAPYPDGWKDGFTLEDVVNKMYWPSYQGFILDEAYLEVQGLKSGQTYESSYSRTDVIPGDAAGNDKLEIKFSGSYDPGQTITVQVKTRAAAGKLEELKGMSGGSFTLYNFSSINGEEVQAQKDHQFTQVSGGIYKSGGAYYDEGQKAYVIEWTIRANASDPYSPGALRDLGGQTITITDTLPDGLTYIPGTSSCWVCDSIHYDPNKTIYNADPDIQGQNLTYSVPNVGKKVIQITFKTKVSRVNQKYENTASWGNGTDSYGSANAETNVQQQLLEKKGNVLTVSTDLNGKTIEANTTIQYTIDVNKDKRNYLQDSDLLTLRDKLPENAKLVIGSIHISGDGGGALEGADYSYDSRTHELIVQIPDGVHAVVTYMLTPILDGLTPTNNQYNVNLNNSVSLEGDASTQQNSSLWAQVVKASATITGNATDLILVKYNSRFSKVLEGAEFQLCKITFDGSGAREERIASQRTGSDGKVTFQNILPDTVYFYQETQAPQGYKLDSTRYYFYYHTQGVGQDAALARLKEDFARYFPGEDLKESAGGAVYDVTNVLDSEAGIVFGGLKSFVNGRLAGDDFEFKIEETDGKGVLDSPLFTKNDPSGRFVFDKIKFKEEGSYSFKVSEVKPDPPAEGVTYDTREYSIEVNVAQGEEVLEISEVKVNGAEVEPDPDSGVYTLRGNHTVEGADKAAAFVNTAEKKTGGLSVAKTVEGKGGDWTKRFHFTVTLDNKEISGTYGGMTFEEGVASLELAHGESVTASGLPAGVKYTVTETGADGYTVTSTGSTGTIPEDGTASAEFTNTFRTGSLTVRKTVAGGGSLTKAFHFTVTLSDRTISGTYGGMTFQNGTAEFVLSHGGSVTAADLPEGVTYTVTETAERSYTSSLPEGGATGGIRGGQESSVDVENTFHTGKLSVTKNVAEGGNLYRDFSFTVELDDRSISGIYGDMEFENGVAQFTLNVGSGSSTKTADGLPAGVGYTVKESNAEGYKAGYENESGVIPADSTAEAVVTNTYDGGSLLVKKTVEGEGADVNREFLFTVTLDDESVTGPRGDVTFTNGVSAPFKLKSGESKLIQGLPAGVSYTVTETPVEGYAATSTGAEGVIQFQETAEAAFTNTYRPGSLTVQKSVVGAPADEKDRSYTFTVTLTNHPECTGHDHGKMVFTGGVATFTLKDGESMTATGLPEGTEYTVTEKEADQDGYATTSEGGSGTITSGQSAAAAYFTNRYQTGSLTVKKNVTGGGSTTKKFHFTVTLSDESVSGVYGGMTFARGTADFDLMDDESVTASGLPAGLTYRVTEAEANVLPYASSSTGASGTIRDRETAEAVFTNAYRTGDLTVSKEVAEGGNRYHDFSFRVSLDPAVSGTYGGMSFNADGVASFTLRHGQSVTASGLPAGTKYTVTELPAAGYDVSYETVSGVVGASGTAQAGTSVSRLLQSGAAQAGTGVSRMLQSGAAQAGTGVSRMLQSGAGTSRTVQADTGASGTIPDGGTETVNVMNTYQGGSLMVKKTAAGRGADLEKDFTFVVKLNDTSVNGPRGDVTFYSGEASFTLRHGQSMTIPGLPAGVQYTVTETGADGYTVTSTGKTGNIPLNGTAQAAFTNTFKTGSLTVSKTVAGRGADWQKEFRFRVELSDKNITGTYGGMTFKDGTAEFALRHNQSVTASDLPAGVTYTVTELNADQDGYAAAVSVQNGAVQDGAAEEAAFTNVFKTGSLEVRKTVDGPGADKTRKFSFTVTLSDPGITGEYGGMTFHNGVAEFELAHGGRKSAAGLPAGVTYTVEEAPVSGYTSDIPEGGAEGVVAYASTSSVSVTNTYHTGSLSVSKEVAEGGNQYGDFSFIVELDDRSISGTYGNMTFEAGVARFILNVGKGEGTKTASGLPAGVGYTVLERRAEGYIAKYRNDVGTIPADGTAEAVVTNTYNGGSLEVAKTVAGEEADPEMEFEFTVTLEDSGVNGPRGEVTFTNGVSEPFKLKSGEKMVIPGLPAGTAYTVTEKPVKGYASAGTGATGTIQSGQMATAAFTNTYRPGSLIVSKSVVDAPERDADREYTFTVTLTNHPECSGHDHGEMKFEGGVAVFTLKDGESRMATGLPVGTEYTVTEAEADKDGYVTSAEGAAGVITAVDTAAARFTNRYQTGGLTVRKTVTGGGSLTKRFHFTVTLSDQNVSGVYGEMTFTDGEAVFDLADGESVTARGLPAGLTYTVAEAEADALPYATSSTGETGTIRDRETAEAVFTNSYRTGGLTVSKEVAEGGNRYHDFAFRVSLDPAVSGTYGDMTFNAAGVASFTLRHGQSVTASGLPAGTKYTVTELPAAGYAVSWETASGAAGGASASGTVQSGTSVSGTVQSGTSVSGTVQTGTSVSGTVQSGTSAFGTVQTGTSAFGTVQSGTSAFGTVQTGTSAFGTAQSGTSASGTAQTDPGVSGIMNAPEMVQADTGVTGTIPDGGTEAVRAMNTYQGGSLVVKKTVTGRGADLEKEFTFVVKLNDTSVSGPRGSVTFSGGSTSFTLRHGQSMTIPGLPAGVQYTVTETGADGYVVTSTGETGSIPLNDTAQAAFTNTFKTGSLTVHKTVEGDGSLTKPFHFVVTLSDEKISGMYGGMTFQDGTAMFDLMDGESVTATDLPDGISYTVTETAEKSYTSDLSDSGETGVISYGEPANVQVTNTYHTGSLSVSKKVAEGGNQYGDFSFIVELDDRSISGTYGDMTFEAGVASFTLNVGNGEGTKTASGLPAGVGYTVLERRAEGYAAEYKNAVGTIPADGTAEAVVTNTYNGGSLEVTKTVAGEEADPEMEFEFTVTLEDSGVNGPRGEVTFTNGVSEPFTLKSGEKMVIPGLPAGTAYTVTEKPVKGYASAGTGATGTIRSGQTATAAFTNTYRPGSLIVSKSVVDAPEGDADREYTFTVTLTNHPECSGHDHGEMKFEGGVAVFTLKDGESRMATGLPVGTEYTVTEAEADKDGYVTSAEGAAGVITAVDTASARFTNRYQTGGLIVRKTVTGGGSLTKRFHFTVTLSDQNVSGVYGEMTFTDGEAGFDLADGESVTAHGLPAGLTYTVAEAEADVLPYATSSTGETGTIRDRETAEAVFTNSYRTGDLTVSKEVAEGGNKYHDFAFRVSLDPAVSGTYGDMTFNADGVASFTLRHGQSVTASGLPAGTKYTVTELPAAGYAVSWETASGAAGGASTSGTVQANAGVSGTVQANAGASGTVQTGASASGTVQANAGASGTVQTGTSASGMVQTGTGVSGKAQTDPGVFGITNAPEAVQADAGVSGAILDGETETVKAMNTYQGGSLMVKKTVAGRGADLEKEFTFVVKLNDTSVSGPRGSVTFNGGETSFTLRHGQSMTIPGLPAGVQYTVTETGADGYTVTSTGETGRIPLNDTAEAAFINTFKIGGLTVRKTVAGRGADWQKEFRFRVELSDKNLTGAYGGMTFKDGTAEFTLRHNQSVTADGLPAGVTYTVTELNADQDGYAAAVSVQKGVIQDGAAEEAAFTNTFKTGSLTVRKTVDGLSADKTRRFSFTVTLSDPEISGEYGDMTFHSGVAEFELAHGGSRTASGLPAGVTYTVEEEPVSGYTSDIPTAGARGVIAYASTSSVSVTNTYHTGSLSVSKKVAEGGNQYGDFSFIVELDDRSISGNYGDMTFEAGVASFTLNVGNGEGTKTASGLPAGVGYTVLERRAEGYAAEYKNAVGTIPSDGTAEAVVTNTYNGGSLEVTKTVAGEEADPEMEFEFTVTLEDSGVNGPRGEVTFTNGVSEPFTLKSGEKMVIPGLPAGTAYTVTEKPVKGYASAGTGATGTIRSGQTATAAFTNTYRPGSLIVSKSVVDAPEGDADREYTFTVTLTNHPECSGHDHGEMKFEGGVAVFTLKDGESRMATGLPVGTEYTVTEAEADKDGYVTSAEGAAGVITAVDTASARFTNRYQTGGLTVRKTVTGGGSLTKRFHFTVTLSDQSVSGVYGEMTFTDGEAVFDLADGESVTARGLPAGLTYTVAEAEADVLPYVSSSTGETGTIRDRDTAEAVFTNAYRTGGLTVSKEVAEGGNRYHDFAFRVSLDPAVSGIYGDMTFNSAGVASFTLRHGQSVTASGLPAGTKYTVTELPAAGYAVSWETVSGAAGSTVQTGTGVSGTVPDGETETVKAMNIYQGGSLMVKKTVAGRGADLEREFTFVVKLNDTSVSGPRGSVTFNGGETSFTLRHGQSMTIPGLPAGVQYTVTETGADGYTVTSTGETGKILFDQTVKAEFVNTFRTGSLTVTKTVQGDGADPDKNFFFTVTLSDRSISGEYGGMTFQDGTAMFRLADGESVTATDLPDGISYTVTETAEKSYTSDLSDSGETGVISYGEPAKVQVTNTYHTGGLSVSKKVAEGGNQYGDFSFIVELEDRSISGTYGDMTFEAGVAKFTLNAGKGEGTKTASGLPAGVGYTVLERRAEGYTAEYKNAVGTIPADGTAEAVVTNIYNGGSLEVTKTVAGEEADPEMEFEFTVTLEDSGVNGPRGEVTFKNGVSEPFKLKSGEKMVIPGLPAGTAYTVTEKPVKGYASASTGATGTIRFGQTATAAFTNTYRPGSLIISKSVVDAPERDADREYTFTVTLTNHPECSGHDHGEMKFEGGVAVFTLKDGESRMATGLPVGTEYTVTEAEADKDGYVTSAEGDTGVITAVDTASARFTNRYQTGGLTVRKTVTGGGSLTKRFHFTVTLSDQNVSGVYGEMTFTDGEAGFDLADGESVTAHGLPAGLTYTVAEAEADVMPYAASSTGETGTIHDREMAEAVFTNAYRTGGLTVSKEVAEGGNRYHDFAFRVSLDPAVSGTYGDMTFNAAGVASFTLRHDQSVTASGLPAGTKYTVTELPAAGYAVSWETVPGAVSGIVQTDAGESGTVQADTGVFGTVQTGTGASGTISNGGTETVKVMNTYQGGSLLVKKTAAGLGADLEKDFTFVVKLNDTSVNGPRGSVTFNEGEASFTLRHGQSVLIPGLPAGVQYTVTETGADGYTVTSTGETGKISLNDMAEAAFTNTFKTGGLTVRKTVAGRGGDWQKEFRFKVELSDKNLTGAYGGMTFKNGTAEFTLRHDQSATALGLPAGLTYTVREETEEEYTVSSIGGKGSILDGGTAEAVFINTFRTGVLTVKKTVNGDTGGAPDRQFFFTVTLSDRSISGEYGGMIFQNGTAMFQLADGESVTATDLPEGVSYTVTETAEKSYTSDLPDSGETGVISYGEPAKVQVTNTYHTGGLSVSKKVAEGGNQYGNFSFIVELDDRSISGTYGDMTFEAGVARFTLNVGNGEGTKTASGLPAGVGYTVLERRAEGYTAEYKNAVGTIPADGTAEVVVTNIYNGGSLEVTKTVAGEEADPEMEFEFTVTLEDSGVNGPRGEVTFKNGVSEPFKLKSGEKMVIPGLPAGTVYTVTEKPVKGYASASTGATGTIRSGQTATAAFTNTYRPGSLIVSKSVVDAPERDSDREYTFTVTLTNHPECSGHDHGEMKFEGGVAVFTLKDGESRMATGLPVGTKYTVTEAEADKDGYVTSAEGDTGVITAVDTASARFTNRYQTGGLTVRKTVTGGGSLTKRFRFTVTLSDQNVSGVYGEMTFTDGEAGFDLADGESATAFGLPAGLTYTVAEAEADVLPYASSSTGETGTIHDRETAEAVFTNAYRTGGLTVSKEVAEGGNRYHDFAFRVSLDPAVSGTYGDMTFNEDGVASFTLRHGQSVTASGLPAGTKYTVTELPAAGYAVSWETVPGAVSGIVQTDAGESGTVQSDTGVPETVQTDNSASGMAQSDTGVSGTVQTDKSASGTVQADAGVPGTVQTDKSASGTVQSDTGVPGTVQIDAGASGTIPDGGTETVKVMNTYQGGSLMVKKTVAGKGADLEKDFTFVVKLNDTSVSGPRGSVTFNGGETSFTLRHGQSMIIPGLPAGVQYTVTETGADGYTVTSTGETGSIPLNGTAQASFTNTVTSVEIDKIDDDGLPVTGAALVIKDARTDEVTDSWITDGTSHDITGKLVSGLAYILEETDVPDGYAAAEPVMFTAGEDGRLIVDGEAAERIQMTDRKIHFNVNKVELGRHEEEVEGAVLEVLDKDGNVIDTWESRQGEIHDFGEKLKAGESYILREKVAPDGYGYITDIQFTVEKDGTITSGLPVTADEEGNRVFLVEDRKIEAVVNKIDATDKTGIAGAKLRIRDEDGNIVEEWESTGEPHPVEAALKAGGVYTLEETEAPENYELAEPAVFTVGRDGTVDPIVMEDARIKAEHSSLTVTKTLTLAPDGERINAVNATFYAALFADAELTSRISGVEPIVFQNSSASSAVFTDLEKGRTYYIAEVDENGDPTEFGAFVTEAGEEAFYFVNFAEGNEAVLEEGENLTVYFENQFENLTDGFYRDSRLKVNKILLDADGQPKNSDEVFYAGVFDDPDCTVPSERVKENLLVLDMAGDSRASASTLAFIPMGGDEVILYVAEVDEEGNLIEGAEGFPYLVSQDEDQAVVAEGGIAAVTITNTEKAELTPAPEVSPTATPSAAPSVTSGPTDTPAPTSAPGTAPRTGDDAPTAQYLLLLAASMILLCAAARRKLRRKIR